MNDDLDDNYEDRNFAKPEAPENELELPDDLNLDGDEGGDDEKEAPGALG